MAYDIFFPIAFVIKKKKKKSNIFRAYFTTLSKFHFYSAIPNLISKGGGVGGVGVRGTSHLPFLNQSQLQTTATGKVVAPAGSPAPHRRGRRRKPFFTSGYWCNSPPTPFFYVFRMNWEFYSHRNAQSLQGGASPSELETPHCPVPVVCPGPGALHRAPPGEKEEPSRGNGDKNLSLRPASLRARGVFPAP